MYQQGRLRLACASRAVWSKFPVLHKPFMNPGNSKDVKSEDSGQFALCRLIWGLTIWIWPRSFFTARLSYFLSYLQFSCIYFNLTSFSYVTDRTVVLVPFYLWMFSFIPPFLSSPYLDSSSHLTAYVIGTWHTCILEIWMCVRNRCMGLMIFKVLK